MRFDDDVLALGMPRPNTLSSTAIAQIVNKQLCHSGPESLRKGRAKEAQNKKKTQKEAQ